MKFFLFTLFFVIFSNVVHAQSCTYIDNEDTKRLCKAFRNEGSCTFIENEDKKRLCKAISKS